MYEKSLNNNNNRRLVTLAEHTSDHGKKPLVLLITRFALRELVGGMPTVRMLNAGFVTHIGRIRRVCKL